MVPRDMTSLLYILTCFTLNLVSAQSQRRYQNPWVNVVRRHACSIVECNFGEVCDLSYDNCRRSPCILKQPTCVTAFNVPRPGRCPSPRLELTPRFYVGCFDDPGCASPLLCCHSYYGSYCYNPTTGVTGRSLIPGVRNNNRVRITLG